MSSYYIHGEPVRVISKRFITGGQVAMVERINSNPAMSLPDGTIHPCHRAGYRWEEPAVNITEVQDQA